MVDAGVEFLCELLFPVVSRVLQLTPGVATPSPTLTVHVVGLYGVKQRGTQLLYFNYEVLSRHGLSFASCFGLLLSVESDVFDHSFGGGLEVGLEYSLARAFPHWASEFLCLRVCGASTR